MYYLRELLMYRDILGNVSKLIRRVPKNGPWPSIQKGTITHIRNATKFTFQHDVLQDDIQLCSLYGPTAPPISSENYKL